MNSNKQIQNNIKNSILLHFIWTCHNSQKVTFKQIINTIIIDSMCVHSRIENVQSLWISKDNIYLWNVVCKCFCIILIMRYSTYSMQKSQEEEQFLKSKQNSLFSTSTNLGMLTIIAASIAGMMYTTRALQKKGQHYVKHH